MKTNEYQKMFELENDYWWYRALHALVEHYVKATGRTDLKILDVGCGTGRMMEVLRNYGNVEGVDYSPEAIFFSNKRGLNNVALGDINDWAVNTDSYDVIICLDVLNHSSIKNYIAVMEKLYSGLTNGGILIMEVAAFEILKRHHDIVVFNERRYRKKEPLTHLQKIGFRIIKATYRLPLLFLFILIKKIAERIAVPDDGASDLKPLPRSLNALLLFLTRAENRLTTMGLAMPFGSSLFIVAKKE